MKKQQKKWKQNETRENRTLRAAESGAELRKSSGNMSIRKYELPYLASWISTANEDIHVFLPVT